MPLWRVNPIPRSSSLSPSPPAPTLQPPSGQLTPFPLSTTPLGIHTAPFWLLIHNGGTIAPMASNKLESSPLKDTLNEWGTLYDGRPVLLLDPKPACSVCAPFVSTTLALVLPSLQATNRFHLQRGGQPRHTHSLLSLLSHFLIDPFLPDAPAAMELNLPATFGQYAQDAALLLTTLSVAHSYPDTFDPLDQWEDIPAPPEVLAAGRGTRPPRPNVDQKVRALGLVKNGRLTHQGSLPLRTYEGAAQMRKEVLSRVEDYAETRLRELLSGGEALVEYDKQPAGADKWVLSSGLWLLCRSGARDGQRSYNAFAGFMMNWQWWKCVWVCSRRWISPRTCPRSRSASEPRKSARW